MKQYLITTQKYSLLEDALYVLGPDLLVELLDVGPDVVHGGAFGVDVQERGHQAWGMSTQRC